LSRRDWPNAAIFELVRIIRQFFIWRHHGNLKINVPGYVNGVESILRIVGGNRSPRQLVRDFNWRRELMSVSLSKEQIRALYGVTGKGEVVAYGRAIPTGIKRSGARRVQVEYDAFGRKIFKTPPSKPTAQVVESQVTEIF
jgi:hypothetical protein